MNAKTRTIGIVWLILGAVLCILAIKALLSGNLKPDAILEVSVLCFSLVAITAGITFGRTKKVGRILVGTVSIASLLWSITALYLVGFQNLKSYPLGLVLLSTFSVYSLIGSTAKVAPHAA